MVLFYARQFKAHGKEIAKNSLSETLGKPTTRLEISMKYQTKPYD